MACRQERTPPGDVSFVDADRFLGEWYEPAMLKIDTSDPCRCYALAFQKMKRAGMRVVKRCFHENGKWMYDKGKAWLLTEGGRAVLQTEYQWPMKGKLYFIELDSNYQYAVLGNQSRTTLHILSRKKEINPSLYHRLLKKATTEGFDTLKIRLVKQDCIH